MLQLSIAGIKAFNTNILNFHQYLKEKLSFHQPSYMHNTRHRTNSNFNTTLFHHSKTQKCYLYQEIPYGIAYQNRLKITLPSLHSKNKLKDTSWHPNLSNVLNYHQILAMSK